MSPKIHPELIQLAPTKIKYLLGRLGDYVEF